MNKKKVLFYVGINFISIYKIYRTLHGRLGLRILSSRTESISHEFASLTRERYFQHEKIKFVSLRSHVISSMSLWKLPHFLHDLKHILKQPMIHSNWQEELILKI